MLRRTVSPLATDPAAPLLSVIYRKSVAATDLVFEAQESPDLGAPWLPAEGSTTLLGETDGIQRIRFTAPASGADRRFLRVEVTPSP